MKSGGLIVDADKIGAGLYSMLCDKGEEAIVAFGMIPAWVINCFEKQLREKIISEAAKQSDCLPSDLAPRIRSLLPGNGAGARHSGKASGTVRNPRDVHQPATAQRRRALDRCAFCF